MKLLPVYTARAVSLILFRTCFITTIYIFIYIPIKFSFVDNRLDRSLLSRNCSLLASIYSCGVQVNELRIHRGGAGDVGSVSSCGGDGRLVLWDLNTLARKIEKLKI